mmetsp:Transcript_116378/g.370229  ORF Transcript_116378/g.370229 Transcript_116378/m.370229 type:complete len:331 (-) Transcript_116378:157-1149(-)
MALLCAAAGAATLLGCSRSAALPTFVSPGAAIAGPRGQATQRSGLSASQPTVGAGPSSTAALIGGLCAAVGVAARLCSGGTSISAAHRDQSKVTMWAKTKIGRIPRPRGLNGGRRENLMISGGKCMLLGKQPIWGYYETWGNLKNPRAWKPNVHWNHVWWEKEKKWVKLFISSAALWDCDKYGLDYMADKAGLDLYAWCLPHWDPASRQPLPLKVSKHPEAQRIAREYWPDYAPFLNKGKPLAQVMPPIPETFVNGVRSYEYKYTRAVAFDYAEGPGEKYTAEDMPPSKVSRPPKFSKFVRHSKDLWQDGPPLETLSAFFKKGSVSDDAV